MLAPFTLWVYGIKVMPARLFPMNGIFVHFAPFATSFFSILSFFLLVPLVLVELSASVLLKKYGASMLTTPFSSAMMLPPSSAFSMRWS